MRTTIPTVLASITAAVFLTGCAPGTNETANFSALSDPQLAAVATFVRTSWGNDFGAVDAATVARSRKR